jgi:hypothetical protein
MTGDTAIPPWPPAQQRRSAGMPHPVPEIPCAGAARPAADHQSAGQRPIFAATALAIYLCDRYRCRLLARLGGIGTLAIMRLFAFTLLCIGIEIMWTGWAALNPIR